MAPWRGGGDQRGGAGADQPLDRGEGQGAGMGCGGKAAERIPGRRVASTAVGWRPGGNAGAVPGDGAGQWLRPGRTRVACWQRERSLRAGQAGSEAGLRQGRAACRRQHRNPTEASRRWVRCCAQGEACIGMAGPGAFDGSRLWIGLCESPPQRFHNHV